MNISAEKIRQAVQSSVPFVIKTTSFSTETEAMTEKILEIFLQEMGQAELKDSLFYCLRELVVNAKKANTKRVYFQETDLDINNEEDYEKGMLEFKEGTLSNLQYYLDRQRDKGFYIKIIFHVVHDRLDLYIVNNAEMTRKEQIRAYDRIARSHAFDTMEEALSTVLDDSEGAGLGFVIMVLMLKKLGLSEDAFDIDTSNGKTVARLTIPMSDVQIQYISDVSEKIIDLIETIPQFPQNLLALQSEINNPDVEFVDIARKIATDPALTADLIKMVNSAAFMLPKRMTNITEAIKLVGLRRLKTLLYSYGAQKTLDNKSPETGALWLHSHRTAFYSYIIVRSLLKKPALLDDVYVSGMLHDMGKIVISSIHPDLILNIEHFSKQKNLTSFEIEDFVTGFNHAEIGARIAEKWNFPKVLVDAIRFHHNPLVVEEDHKTIAITVYLANSLANVDEGILDYEQINSTVLALMNINSLESLKQIHEKIRKKFEQIQES